MDLPANKILPSVGRSFHSRGKTVFAKANDFLLKSTEEAYGLTPRLPIPTFKEIYSGKNEMQLPESGSNDYSPSAIPSILPKETQPTNTTSIQPESWKGNTLKSTLADNAQAIQNPNLGKIKDLPIDSGVTEPVNDTNNTSESWFEAHKLAIILVILLVIFLLVYLNY